MPKELHRKIAREAFWNPVAKYLDFDCLTIYVVDFLWGSGQAPLKIQKYLNTNHNANIPEDNKWGPQTAKSLNSVAKKFGAKNVLKDLINIREHYLLVELQPAFSVFYNGWKNRLLDVRKIINECLRIKKKRTITNALIIAGLIVLGIFLWIKYKDKILNYGTNIIKNIRR